MCTCYVFLLFAISHNHNSEYNAIDNKIENITIGGKYTFLIWNSQLCKLFKRPKNFFLKLIIKHNN